MSNFVIGYGWIKILINQFDIANCQKELNEANAQLERVEQLGICIQTRINKQNHSNQFHNIPTFSTLITANQLMRQAQIQEPQQQPKKNIFLARSLLRGPQALRIKKVNQKQCIVIDSDEETEKKAKRPKEANKEIQKKANKQPEKKASSEAEKGGRQKGFNLGYSFQEGENQEILDQKQIKRKLLQGVSKYVIIKRKLRQLFQTKEVIRQELEPEYPTHTHKLQSTHTHMLQPTVSQASVKTKEMPESRIEERPQLSLKGKSHKQYKEIIAGLVRQAYVKRLNDIKKGQQIAKAICKSMNRLFCPLVDFSASQLFSKYQLKQNKFYLEITKTHPEKAFSHIYHRLPVTPPFQEFTIIPSKVAHHDFTVGVLGARALKLSRSCWPFQVVGYFGCRYQTLNRLAIVPIPMKFDKFDRLKVRVGILDQTVQFFKNDKLFAQEELSQEMAKECYFFYETATQGNTVHLISPPTSSTSSAHLITS